MNLDALFKITYGLFVAGVGENGNLGGCIINTAAQVTAEPPRMLVTIQKSTQTAQMIRRKGSLALSVLSRDCPMEVIQRFGYRSGREGPKFDGIPFCLDARGNPLLERHVCASVSLRVERVVDVDTHWLFLCPVEDCAEISAEPGLTYDDYRALKAGVAPGPAAAPVPKRYTCTVCHYVYDGEVPFEELPDDYVCPICGVGKDRFIFV